MKPEAETIAAMAGCKITCIDEARPNLARTLWRRICLWARGVVPLRRRQPRRLRLGETLQLGDKRFVAVVEFEQARFLVGGTAASLALLARLDPEGAAHDDIAPLRPECGTNPVQPALPADSGGDRGTDHGKEIG